MPNISAILFDVDGTLLDTYRLYVEAYRRALASFLGTRVSDAEIIARSPSSERRFLADWVGDERLESCHTDFCRHYADLHAAFCDGPYDGVREMLTALSAAGIRLAVVTGKGRAAWRLAEESLVPGVFEAIVTDEDAEHPKPHPDGIQRALGSLGLPPEEAVYVGDSVTDLLAGRNAGVPVAAALWPKSDPADRAAFLEAIAPIAPDWIFERPADLSRTFAAWC